MPEAGQQCRAQASLADTTHLDMSAVNLEASFILPSRQETESMFGWRPSARSPSQDIAGMLPGWRLVAALGTYACQATFPGPGAQIVIFPVVVDAPTCSTSNTVVALSSLQLYRLSTERSLLVTPPPPQLPPCLALTSSSSLLFLRHRAASSLGSRCHLLLLAPPLPPPPPSSAVGRTRMRRTEERSVFHGFTISHSQNIFFQVQIINQTPHIRTYLIRQKLSAF